MDIQTIYQLIKAVKTIAQGIQAIKNAHILEMNGIKYEPMKYVSYVTRDGMPIRKWYVTYPGGYTWWGMLSKNWNPHGYGEFKDPQGNLIPDGCGGFWDDGKFLGRDPEYEAIAFSKGFLCCYTGYDSLGRNRY